MVSSSFNVVAYIPYGISLLLIKMKTSCQNLENNYLRLLKSKPKKAGCREEQNIEKKVRNVSLFFLTALPWRMSPNHKVTYRW